MNIKEVEEQNKENIVTRVRREIMCEQIKKTG